MHEECHRSSVRGIWVRGVCPGTNVPGIVSRRHIRGCALGEMSKVLVQDNCLA